MIGGNFHKLWIAKFYEHVTSQHTLLNISRQQGFDFF